MVYPHLWELDVLTVNTSNTESTDITHHMFLLTRILCMDSREGSIQSQISLKPIL